ncbi:unnamed protein product, partial [Ectocarpus sp. 4 AP-2014]
MEDHARRVSDELRHKHIRTLEVLRQLIDENNAIRKKLKVFEGEERVPDGATDLREKPNANNQNEEELEVTDGVDTTAASTFHAIAHYFYPLFNVEIERVMAQLAQAQAETTKARAAEEVSELTLAVLLAQNKDLETSRAAVERRCQEQVEHCGVEIAQLKEQLASTIAEAQAAQERAKLDVSRLESEVEELRHNTSQAALSRLGTAWMDDGDDDESVLSQREVVNLQRCLRTVSRRELTAKRRCLDLERQAKSEVLRRESVERELLELQAVAANMTAPNGWPQIERVPPLPAVPNRNRRSNGGNTVRKGRSGASITLVDPPPELTCDKVAEPQPVVVLPLACPGGSDIDDDGSVASLDGGPRKKAATIVDVDGDSNLGSGIRRLRESEKILRESNAKLQRELRQTVKRLEKAEAFASDVQAELQKVAGDGVTFETFVVLKRDNQALKTQLAEIKQAYSMVLASSPSRKVNISFSDTALRKPPIRTESKHGRGGSVRNARGLSISIRSRQRPPSSRSQPSQEGSGSSLSSPT